jgi:hypothetical protein
VPEEIGGQFGLWPGEPLFEPDGTFVVGTPGGIVAVDRFGQMRPGWPVTAENNPIAMGPDGSVYVSDCAAEGAPCALHRFGQDGREPPGWPYNPGCEITMYTVGEDGTVYAGCNRADQTNIVALDTTGSVLSGWPVNATKARDESVVGSAVAANRDGKPYLYVFDGQALTALGIDGHPRPGWPTPVAGSSPRMFIARNGLPATEGNIVVWSYDGSPITRSIFTIIGPDGQTRPGWPRGSKGEAMDVSVAPDGTLYYLSATGRLYRHLRDGDVASGWPVIIPGAASLGCKPDGGRQCLSIGSDGTAYVAALGPDGASMLMALDRNGQPLPGWPYKWNDRVDRYFDNPWYFSGYDPNTSTRPIVITRDGTVYLAIGGQHGAEIVAVDRSGRVMPGWPYFPPGDVVARSSSDVTFVSAMTLGPANSLYVVISAYDPEASIPNGDPTKVTLLSISLS